MKGKSESVRTPIKYVPIKSKRFLCSTCLEFCIEMTPVIQRGMGQVFFDELRRRRLKQGRLNTMKVDLRCPNGHHSNPMWSFHDVTIGNKRRFKP